MSDASSQISPEQVSAPADIARIPCRDDATQLSPGRESDLRPRAKAWGISEHDFRDVLRELVFRYQKWDTNACGRCAVLPESIVLSRRTHEHIVEMVESVAAALAIIERRVLKEPSLLGALAIPPRLHPLIVREPASDLHIGRYDLFFTREGRWVISEFNEDVPGGFNETIGLPEIFRGAIDGLRFEGDLKAALQGAFGERERTIALFFATGYSEDLQHMTLLAEILAEVGKRPILASPAHLRSILGRPTIGKRPIDAAYRFYPAEWIPLLPNFETWQRIGPKLRMMNPLHRLIRQSKNLFAVWRFQEMRDSAESRVLNAVTPMTKLFDPGMTSRILAEKDRWVLKHTFGRMGDSVTLGSLETPEGWKSIIQEALSAPHEYTLQERFDVMPLDFSAGPLYPTIGAYVVGGRFAGYYARAAETPLITHKAFHVATTVETL